LERRRLYLMRHADVSYAAPPGARVDPESVPLTEEGRKQAASAALALASVPLDRVITSGLLRTRETAEIVVGDRGLVIESEGAFEEIRPGRLDRVPREELRGMFLSAVQGAAPEDRFLLGETWGSFRDRVLPKFAELLASPGWRELLLVTHGGVNRILILSVLGLGLESLGRFEQDACALSILDILEDGAIQVRLLNATFHDPGKTTLRETTMERLVRSFEVLRAED
jgi:broad specificity phosphatase PhoE